MSVLTQIHKFIEVVVTRRLACTNTLSFGPRMFYAGAEHAIAFSCGSARSHPAFLCICTRLFSESFSEVHRQ